MTRGVEPVKRLTTSVNNITNNLSKDESCNSERGSDDDGEGWGVCEVGWRVKVRFARH